MSERGYLTTEQFNATDYNFPYTASISSAVTGVPEPGYYNVLYLPLKDTPGYGTQVISNVNEPGRLFLRQSTTNGMWEPWISIPTAIPPQEHDLPLAAGVSAARISKYSKAQDGLVVVSFNVIFAAAESRTKVLLTLPAGYRPAEMETGTCDVTTSPGDVIAPAVVEVYENGTLQVYGNAAAYTGAVGKVVFYAT